MGRETSHRRLREDDVPMLWLHPFATPSMVRPDYLAPGW